MRGVDDHFRRPRNAGVLEDADLRVEVENPVCGDVLRLFLRRDGAGVVEDARFQAYGCPAAIAAGSLLTELILGKGRDEIAALDAGAVDEALGGLASDKRHAAVLAQDAVRRAIESW